MTKKSIEIPNLVYWNGHLCKVLKTYNDRQKHKVVELTVPGKLPYQFIMDRTEYKLVYAK